MAFYSAKNMRPAAAVLVLVVTLTALVASSEGRSLIGLCIRNCGYCKEMYGDYFNGGECAESCVQTTGSSIPDCNRPSTFRRFIRRFQFSP
ncbi:Eclosion hormone [Trinorchestia longiramus]|nr:Eclosion hormone [Trinorchestia longiramus]